MPHRYKYGTGWASCLTVTVGVLGLVLGGLAIGFGAWNGFNYDGGLEDEGDFAFPLSVWSIVFGSVLLLGMLVYAIDVWSRAGDMYVRPPSCWGWIWAATFIFLGLPWNIIGHVFLLRAWQSTGDSSTALYGVSIAALVVSWAIVAKGIWFLLDVLYEHNKQIGISRRYLSFLSAAITESGMDLPVLDAKDNTLPYIMREMMEGKRDV